MKGGEGGPAASHITHASIQHILTISLPLEILGPVPRKYMISKVGHFTLQPMAHTNHIFPRYSVRKEAKSTVPQ